MMMNQEMSSFENSVDQDQLASTESNWSGSTLFQAFSADALGHRDSDSLKSKLKSYTATNIKHISHTCLGQTAIFNTVA